APGPKICNWGHRDAGRAGGRWPLVVGPRLQICARQILPWGGAGLRVPGRLRGGQRVDRSVETEWPSARHRKTGRNSRKSPQPRHWARDARDFQPIRAPGRAQGVGFTARRDRALSTHLPAGAAVSPGLDRRLPCRRRSFGVKKSLPSFYGLKISTTLLATANKV